MSGMKSIVLLSCTKEHVLLGSSVLLPKQDICARNNVTAGGRLACEHQQVSFPCGVAMGVPRVIDAALAV